MGKTDKITLLLETFSRESENLYLSMKNSNMNFLPVVVEDDGFLPDGVESVYGFFMGDYKNAPGIKGTPLYFNQISIPDYWRFEGNNSYAHVKNRHLEVANIFYSEPKEKRLVKEVDWKDEYGNVRLSEHYNKYGALFCKTIFNKSGQKVYRKFFTPDGREVVLENFVTGTYLIHYDGKDILLGNKTDFLCFYLRSAGLDEGPIFFNTLSYPFFVSQALGGDDKRDILFWNEPIRDGIPGNMKIILDGLGSRTSKIFVQRSDAYDRLIELGVDASIVKKLGYVYDFARDNGHRPEALICTNSDQVSHADELAKMLPQIHFHIAAVTEMSPKLTAVGNNDNVSLYPNVKPAVLEKLFMDCDFYLDINHGNEICDAIHRAFLNNMLIVGFEETRHDDFYVAETNRFAEADFVDMAEALALAAATPSIIEDALVMQRASALSECVDAYKSLQDI